MKPKISLISFQRHFFLFPCYFSYNPPHPLFPPINIVQLSTMASCCVIPYKGHFAAFVVFVLGVISQYYFPISPQFINILFISFLQSCVFLFVLYGWYLFMIKPIFRECSYIITEALVDVVSSLINSEQTPHFFQVPSSQSSEEDSSEEEEEEEESSSDDDEDDHVGVVVDSDYDSDDDSDYVYESETESESDHEDDDDDEEEEETESDHDDSSSPPSPTSYSSSSEESDDDDDDSELESDSDFNPIQLAPFKEERPESIEEIEKQSISVFKDLTVPVEKLDESKEKEEEQKPEEKEPTTADDDDDKVISKPKKQKKSPKKAKSPSLTNSKKKNE
jgi:hypothetical protein